MNSKQRFALHIENKKEGGRFADGQAEAYAFRAKYMMNNEKYLGYADFETVLIAPIAFRARNRAKCDLFGGYLSYEDIARFIPEFGVSSSARGASGASVAG